MSAGWEARLDEMIAAAPETPAESLQAPSLLRVGALACSRSTKRRGVVTGLSPSQAVIRFASGRYHRLTREAFTRLYTVIQ